MDAAISTPQCLLRPLEEDDLEAFALYRSDPEVARYQSWWPPVLLEDARALLARVRAAPFGTPGTWHQIAVTDSFTGALLGDCAVHFLEDGRQIEIGFTLARAHQGRGYMREALPALLDHLFGPLATHRVHARTDARNKPAIALLEHLGFRREAHFIQSDFFKGAWCDELVFACLATEWQARRGAGSGT